MALYEFELGKAADILTKELFNLQPGETFIITADTESDPDVVNATARSVFSVGAKPMVIWLASPDETPGSCGRRLWPGGEAYRRYRGG